MDQAEKLRNLVRKRNSVQTPNVVPSKSRVIAVSSGKGGVGKSNFTLNLAIALKQYGKRIVIMDTDFGLANIEVLFGKSPQYTFLDVVKSRKTIVDVLSEGPAGVQFISGGSAVLEQIKENDTNTAYIASNFALLDDLFDYVLIDTGAGISKNVIDFIMAAHETVIVTTPEPTSITDSYALIKMIKHSAPETNMIPDLHVVVNRVDSAKEGKEIFMKLQSVTGNFLNMKIDILGLIPFDQHLIKAVKQQRPAQICYPNCQFSKAINLIAQNIIKGSDNYNNSLGGTGFIDKLVRIFNA